MLTRLRQFLPENSRQYREATSQRIAWGHWFALFNVVLALLIASRYAFTADWPNTLIGKLYFFVSLFGHFSFVVFAAYLLLLFPLSFLIKNDRAFRSISVIFATFGLTVLLLDTEVFNRFYLHLSALVWDLLINPDNGDLARHWQLLFVPMPLILLLEMLYSRWCWQKLRSFNRQKWGKYVALFFLVCFMSTHLIYAWADMALYRPITTQKANYPLSYPMTARSFLEKHGLIDRANLEQQIEEKGRLDAFYLNYPKSQLQAEISQPINLLLINLSGLSKADITNELMPSLSQVASQSRVFQQHYNSGDSAMAATAGLFYSLSGRYVDSILNEKKASPLIQILQGENYQFGLFSHNNFAEPIYRALFADFKLPKVKNSLDGIEQWKKWLAQTQDKPFFSYLDLNLPAAKERDSQIKLYDWQFNEIWQALQTQGKLQRTLVVITADLADNQAAQPFAANRISVPMMVYWQGQTGEYLELSSHLDLLPTLLPQFFGVKNPLTDYAQGIDLTKPNERRWLLASNHQWNVAIMPDGEQYHLDRKGHFEHFDAEGNKQSASRPPLALFLQMIQQSNQFVEK